MHFVTISTEVFFDHPTLLPAMLAWLEADLHAARGLAVTATTQVIDEQQRRVRAETALERYTRISALQRAASEALQFSITSPGRADPVEEQSAADEAMAKLAAEIRASGLGAPSRSGTPRSREATPRGGRTSFAAAPSPASRPDAGLFVRG